MPSFTWTPDFGATKKVNSRVVEARFGDGYSQRQQIGMNPSMQEWSLTFNNRNLTEANEITDFLEARGGTESFDFTPPGSEDSITVVCRPGQWSITTVKFNLYSITAKFEQVFEP